MVHTNPFCDPNRPPQWAQLTRLAGDRAAILFEDLRRQVADIEGLIEDLHYFGPELGWAPRYRVGNDSLFEAYIMPGFLEASLELNRPSRERVLSSRRIATVIKTAVQAASASGELVRVKLGNKAAVRAFANLVRFLSKNLGCQHHSSSAPPRRAECRGGYPRWDPSAACLGTFFLQPHPKVMKYAGQQAFLVSALNQNSCCNKSPSAWFNPRFTSSCRSRILTFTLT